MSTNAGRLGFFLSDARQVTDMRREAVAYDTLTFKPINVHNHGEDIFTFGKTSFSASNTDVFNLDMNYSRTRHSQCRVAVPDQQPNQLRDGPRSR